jgi:hypothetical protein
MFHWICPECGREIAPAVKHCPVCEPDAVPVSPETSLASKQGSNAASSAMRADSATAVAVAQEPTSVPPPFPPPPLSPAILREPQAARSPEIRFEPQPEVLAVNESAPVPEALAALSDAMREAPIQPVPQPSGFAPLNGIHPAVSSWAPLAAESPVSTLPGLVLPASRSARPAEDVLGLLAEQMEAQAAAQAAAAVPDPEMAGLARLPEDFCSAPAPAGWRNASPPDPVSPATNFAPVGWRQPDQAPACGPAAVERQMRTPEPVRPSIPDWSSPSAAEPAAPAERPATPEGLGLRNRLLGGTLRIGWLRPYSPDAFRSMQPAQSHRRPMQPDTAPRITLPGPTLPSELLSLSQAGLSAIPGFPRRKPPAGFPSWVISGTVMAVLLLGGIAAASYVLPGNPPNPAANSEPPSGTMPSNYPLAKYVEVTGFRFVMDLNRRSEIHYLVVNHSAAPLTGVTVVVTLRAARSKPGAPPLARFSFQAPELQPFESREMTSAIEKLTRPVELPEWQDLRAEVDIGQ